MKPDEVVSLLNDIGIPVSVPTLARYVRDCLVSEPERGGHGRGGGRWTEYSLYGIVEAATAWKLLNGKIEIPGDGKQTIRFSPGMVEMVREEALLEFGAFVNGTEGSKFINPKFIVIDGVDNYGAELKRELDESREEMLRALEAIEALPLDNDRTKKSRFPRWFPQKEWLDNRFEIGSNLRKMIQCAYVYEYGESILSLLPKLENED